ncbi:thiamine pyrophosphate-dependent enzyme [Engelhardtia mirabilis]|uniref:Thiamine pyrophosphate-containing protein YdaP n=1 Tax=Engelhardtia mirabilis TaxID=2528011 RepID=A0A518BEL7_9BACT|nr:Putative thiamine pyrophosphate-containing protein YdaP [Planctomycetes bacterium Pla133]QDU99754.1 Putative thiamine pyrophosphate-containing protein YdaP [Planctomycetes bacterium Pla86]
MSQQRTELVWHRVADRDELPEGRVKTVTAGHKSLCLTHFEGRHAALDNRCPHQGGPLGEGSIEKGLLRCPWHGWDYHPCTGKAPGFDDGVETFQLEEREDGIFVGLPAEASHTATVTDVMAQTMTAWGIDAVFGMVGHSNLGLADALRLEEEAGNLRFFGVRHEGAAAFACSGYAKLTGRPAACLTIAGPGATNLLTGLWDAKVDRAPVLALTGQVDTQVLGPGAFQEVDLASAFSAVTAFSQTVLHDSKHAELVALALKTAIVQRDVAHLIFPDEVQTLPAPEGAEPSEPRGRIANASIAPPLESLDAALELLRGAKRPTIVVGHGARFSMDSVIELAEMLDAPVLTTFKAKGIIPDDHPLACGVLGRSGTSIASYFMNEADVLLVFGASFSNHTGITPKIPTIQVDFDRMALGKFHAIEVPVWGDIDVTAQALLTELVDADAANVEGADGGPSGDSEREVEGSGHGSPAAPSASGAPLAHGASSKVNPRGEIAERWAIWRDEKARRREDDRGRGLNSATVFEALSIAVDEDAVIAVDVGNNTYSFGRYFECRNQSVLMSGYLGSIGFGFPAAMGAWAAEGDRRQIVSVSGDGGFGQYMGEITTAVKYGMDITHVLLNNSELGKISKEQRAGQWDVWQTSLQNPNFAEFASGCGALGIRVTSPDELDGALRQALDHEGPALVEIITDVELI